MDEECNQHACIYHSTKKVAQFTITHIQDLKETRKMRNADKHYFSDKNKMISIFFKFKKENLHWIQKSRIG